MTRKLLAKSKLADAERPKRFVAMAGTWGLDDAKNFERAFQKAFKSPFENVAWSKTRQGIEHLLDDYLAGSVCGGPVLA